MSKKNYGGQLDQGRELQWVALGRIHVRPEGQGQRAFRAAHPIFQDEFDPARFGTPTLNREADRFWVVDGQHRVERYRRELLPKERETQQIQCWVHVGLSIAQEADLFLALNHTLNVDAFAKFQNAVTAGHSDETSVEKIARAKGYTVSRGNADGTLSCVTTALKVLRRNPESLARALGIIAEAFGPKAMDRHLLDGLGLLADRYNGQLKDDVAVQQLHALRGGSTALMQRATVLKKSTGSPTAQCVAAAATEIINRRPGKKLPNWWTAD